MTATVTNFTNASSGLAPTSRRFALRRSWVTTIYGETAEHSRSQLWRRVSNAPAAMSGESLAIWAMSGIAALGFLVLVFGGGTL